MTTFTTEDRLKVEQQEKREFIDGEFIPLVGWVQYEPVVIVNCGASVPHENAPNAST